MIEPWTVKRVKGIDSAVHHELFGMERSDCLEMANPYVAETQLHSPLE